ncbi:hypothetical protein BO94DRAFT_531668 [Aspergillus sclerotioniger CBS 115572]|uniref:Exonuclease V, mitochondrial n=1 Tax=Aspergillus sclerotioniger CBS 115572 TaxID=1450535 RepID=A0A317X7Z3_9EURO|nr:hypothetical protein BO94DRAFT_531668 [Aspergillus sclerotioniger CBS 115572]PWY94734.1 hypothetical protein BO94DRAFT_531668 [Aspergillus sclerotioniger CBS 115572]
MRIPRVAGCLGYWGERSLHGRFNRIGRVVAQEQRRFQATFVPRLRLVEHPDSTEGREKERERQAARHEERINDVNAELDTRSPVERFRRPPHKAFSVTDLISPAWCELQYWYTLTKFGRKRRTPAMKLGSTIHKTLEDEIYTTVPVDITTKEDALALRIWNIIQGLRMLREYGITRELEVWGLVDGELVTGVIDQLSYECPDSELEATAATYYADIEASRAILPEYQMSLSDYLLSATGGGRLLSDVYEQENAPKETEDPDMMASSQESNVPHIPRIYLTDVKTRGSGSAPTVKSTSFRPTLLQLQLYYHMLNRLATSDDVNIELLASRYNLDSNKPFTDAFIAEVGGLNDQFFDALVSQEFDPDYIPTPQDAIERRQSPHSSQSSSASPPPSSTSQDSTSILLTHNTLTSLWSLMKEQLRLTFLPPSDSLSVAPSIPSEFQPRMLEQYPTILSPLLTARYISSKPTAELQPRVLGSRSFLFDPTSMTSYITDQMHWWRGERDPRGVEVMEAWKCRICEFKEECSWRQEREWTYARRSRGRKAEEYDVNV